VGKLKRRNAWNKAKEAEGPSKIVVGAKYVLALLALATLCVCAAAQEETAESWFKKGQELGRNGSYEEAVKTYDKAIELEPSNATFYISKVPGLNMLALLTKNQSKFNESLQAIDKALEIDPKNPRAWELKGNALSQMKRYNESLEAYERGIQNIGNYKGEISQTEESSGLWLGKAMALWQVGRTEESLGAFNESLRIDPANHDAWMMKGRTLAYLGLINESLKAFDEAASLEIFGPRPEVRASSWITKGNALMLTGRYLNALKVYDNVTGLNFTGTEFGFYLVDAWRGRSNALAGLGRYNESLQAFDKAIGLNSEKAPYAWTGKGDALLASGRYDEAIIAYDRALKLYPEFADAGIAHAQKGKGDSLTKLGKREEALAAYGAAVGASDKAITAFNNATPLDKAISFTFDPYPLDQKFWDNRGIILKALGRTSEANVAFAKAKELGYQE
jgi:superkiller protein 3